VFLVTWHSAGSSHKFSQHIFFILKFIDVILITCNGVVFLKYILCLKSFIWFFAPEIHVTVVTAKSEFVTSVSQIWRP
jgi:hypothetical protein